MKTLKNVTCAGCGSPITRASERVFRHGSSIHRACVGKLIRKTLAADAAPPVTLDLDPLPRREDLYADGSPA